ncbi:Tetratricopeptide repeat domain 35 [Gracilaria domingensis]|nr:Tetratricopeptide repeat domain 35 [Gracilaria domingensis]
MASAAVAALLPRAAQSAAAAAQLLSAIADGSLYLPQLVAQHAALALTAHRPTSRRYWDVLEQLFIAACQLRDNASASSALSRILGRFPDSARSRVLRGLSLEANCDWIAAANEYIQLIAEHPRAQNAYKRQIALFKSQRKLPEAAALLHHYLDMFATDFDAWAELCSLALQLGRFAHAIFAANELLVIDPENHAAHVVVADVYVTLGGVEHLCLARKHYAASLALRPAPNLRALYGLWLVCAMIIDGELLDDDTERSTTMRLLTLARKGITAVYANSSALSGGIYVATTLGSSVYTGKKRMIRE